MSSQEDKRRELLVRLASITAHRQHPSETSTEILERLISEADYVLESMEKYNRDLDDERDEERERCVGIVRSMKDHTGDYDYALERAATAIEAGDE